MFSGAQALEIAIHSGDVRELYSGTIILDNDDTSGDLKLQFGQSLNESILWDDTNNYFVFSDDVNFGDNQLLSARIENLISAPTCDGTVIGKIYHNTTDSNSYICDGTVWEQIDANGSGTTYAQTITVAKSGGDYTSVKSALDSITDASASKRYQVLVYPGTYTENAMIIPDYVGVKAAGGLENTIIEAANTTDTIFTSGLYSMVEGFTLKGATSGTCYYTADESSLFNLSLENCDTGIEVTGSSTILTADEVVVKTGTFGKVITVNSSAETIFSGVTINGGTITTGIEITGSGTIGTFPGAMITATNVTTALYVNDSAVANIQQINVQNATTGIYLGPTGSPVAQGPGGLVINNDTYDIRVDSATAEIYFSGWRANKDKWNINPSSIFLLNFNDDTENEESFSVFGELSVGSPEKPSESIFGEGDSYTYGMLVYTETSGGSFADVSTAAASALSSTFTFPGTAADNAIYISTNRTDIASNLVKFYGHKLRMGGTGVTLGSGGIVYEYWNGSAWTEFSVMCTHASLFYPYNGDCFLRPSTDEHVRFEDRIGDNWVQNDPPSTGTNRYWVRLRIDSAVTTAPVFEQFKVHSNRTEINSDGTITFHGKARERKTFVVSPETIFYGRGSNAPDNVTFTVGNTGSWSDERFRSAFNGNSTLEEITGSVTIPKGIDTSNGLRVRIYWKKLNGNTGNVEWKLDYVKAGARNVLVADGTNVDPGARSTGDVITSIDAVTVQTTATGSSSPASEVIFSEFTTDIDISGLYEGDNIFLRLYRDPTDTDDTYGSDAIMVGFEMNGVFWTTGEKL